MAYDKSIQHLFHYFVCDRKDNRLMSQLILRVWFSYYVYQPTQADYRLLAGTVDEYLQVFQRQEEAQEHSPQMC